MGKKVDIDKEIDGLDLNFPGLDDFDSEFDFDSPLEPKSKDRSPAKDFTSGVANKLITSNAAAQNVSALINEYFPETGGMINSATNTYSTVQSLRTEIMKEVTPVVNQLKVTSRQLLPRIKNLMPESIYEKVLDKLSENEEYSVNPEKEKQIARDNSIAEQLSNIFEAKHKEDTQLREREETEKMVERTLDQVKFNKSYDLSQKSTHYLKELLKFQMGPTRGYMMKSLELKYRIMYGTQDTVELMKHAVKILDEKLEGIKHNTGLPEWSKERKGEEFRRHIRDKFIGATYDTAKHSLFGADFATKFGEALSSTVREKILDFKETISSSLDMMGAFLESQETMDEVSPTSDHTKSGEMVGAGINSLLMHMFGEDIAREAPRWINRLNLGAKGWSRKLEQNLRMYGKTNDGFIAEVINKMIGDDSFYRFKTEKNLNKTQYDPTPFDVMTRRAIVDIIPSYLAKILNVATATHAIQRHTLPPGIYSAANIKKFDIDPDNELVFDTEREDFITTRRMQADIKKTLHVKKHDLITGKVKGIVNKIVAAYLGIGGNIGYLNENYQYLAQAIENLVRNKGNVDFRAIAQTVTGKGKSLNQAEIDNLAIMKRDIPPEKMKTVFYILNKALNPAGNTDHSEFAEIFDEILSTTSGIDEALTSNINSLGRKSNATVRMLNKMGIVDRKTGYIKKDVIDRMLSTRKLTDEDFTNESNRKSINDLAKNKLWYNKVYGKIDQFMYDERSDQLDHDDLIVPNKNYKNIREFSAWQDRDPHINPFGAYESHTTALEAQGTAHHTVLEAFWDSTKLTAKEAKEYTIYLGKRLVFLLKKYLSKIPGFKDIVQGIIKNDSKQVTKGYVKLNKAKDAWIIQQRDGIEDLTERCRQFRKDCSENGVMQTSVKVFEEYLDKGRDHVIKKYGHVKNRTINGFNEIERNMYNKLSDVDKKTYYEIKGKITNSITSVTNGLDELKGLASSGYDKFKENIKKLPDIIDPKLTTMLSGSVEGSIVVLDEQIEMMEIEAHKRGVSSKERRAISIDRNKLVKNRHRLKRILKEINTGKYTTRELIDFIDTTSRTTGTILYTKYKQSLETLENIKKSETPAMLAGMVLGKVFAENADKINKVLVDKKGGIQALGTNIVNMAKGIDLSKPEAITGNILATIVGTTVEKVEKVEKKIESLKESTEQAVANFKDGFKAGANDAAAVPSEDGALKDWAHISVHDATSITSKIDNPDRGPNDVKIQGKGVGTYIQGIDKEAHFPMDTITSFRKSMGTIFKFANKMFGKQNVKDALEQATGEPIGEKENKSRSVDYTRGVTIADVWQDLSTAYKGANPKAWDKRRITKRNAKLFKKYGDFNDPYKNTVIDILDRIAHNTRGIVKRTISALGTGVVGTLNTLIGLGRTSVTASMWTLGNMLNLGSSAMKGLFKYALPGFGSAAGYTIDKMWDFTKFSSTMIGGALKNTINLLSGGRMKRLANWVNIFRIDEIDLSNPLLTVKQQKNAHFEDGSKPKGTNDINKPLYDDETNECILTADDIKHGIVDKDNAPIGKVTLGVSIIRGIGSLIKGTGRAIAGTAKGIKDITTAGLGMAKTPVETMFKLYGKILGLGVDGVRGVGRFLYDRLLKPINRTDLEDILGKRLDTIIDLMRANGPVWGDMDGDGDREGSVRDLEQKAKIRKEEWEENQGKKREKREKDKKDKADSSITDAAVASALAGGSNTSLLDRATDIATIGGTGWIGWRLLKKGWNKVFNKSNKEPKTPNPLEKATGYKNPSMLQRMKNFFSFGNKPKIEVDTKGGMINALKTGTKMTGNLFFGNLRKVRNVKSLVGQLAWSGSKVGMAYASGKYLLMENYKDADKPKLTKSQIDAINFDIDNYNRQFEEENMPYEAYWDYDENQIMTRLKSGLALPDAVSNAQADYSNMSEREFLSKLDKGPNPDKRVIADTINHEDAGYKLQNDLANTNLLATGGILGMKGTNALMSKLTPNMLNAIKNSGVSQAAIKAATSKIGSKILPGLDIAYRSTAIWNSAKSSDWKTLGAHIGGGLADLGAYASAAAGAGFAIPTFGASAAAAGAVVTGLKAASFASTVYGIKREIGREKVFGTRSIQTEYTKARFITYGVNNTYEDMLDFGIAEQDWWSAFADNNGNITDQMKMNLFKDIIDLDLTDPTVMSYLNTWYNKRFLPLTMIFITTCAEYGIVPIDTSDIDKPLPSLFNIAEKDLSKLFTEYFEKANTIINDENVAKYILSEDVLKEVMDVEGPAVSDKMLNLFTRGIKKVNDFAVWMGFPEKQKNSIRIHKAHYKPVTTTKTDNADKLVVAGILSDIDSGSKVKKARVYRTAMNRLNNIDLKDKIVPNTNSPYSYAFPVTEQVITSPFGERNIPESKNKFHNGVDLRGKLGDPVFAWCEGKIITDKDSRGNNWVIIKHADGTFTRYGHMNKVYYRVGDEVRTGDVLGTVGTGHGKYPAHLHFEVWDKQGPINPDDYFRYRLGSDYNPVYAFGALNGLSREERLELASSGKGYRAYMRKLTKSKVNVNDSNSILDGITEDGKITDNKSAMNKMLSTANINPTSSTKAVTTNTIKENVNIEKTTGISTTKDTPKVTINIDNDKLANTANAQLNILNKVEKHLSDMSTGMKRDKDLHPTNITVQSDSQLVSSIAELVSTIKSSALVGSANTTISTPPPFKPNGQYNYDVSKQS